MPKIVASRFWRDPQTGDVLREDTYDSGTVTNPMPDGASLATEQDYFVGLGKGEDDLAAWIQRGLQAAGKQ